MSRYTDSDALLGLGALVVGLGLLAVCAAAAIVAWLIRRR